MTKWAAATGPSFLPNGYRLLPPQTYDTRLDALGSACAGDATSIG